jgi:hypothetical protein
MYMKRKFPIYSIAQETNMQIMLLLVIVGYIAYDQIPILDFWGYVIIGFVGTLVVLLFKKQLNNMKFASVLSTVKSKRGDCLKINWKIKIFFNLVITLLSAFHFYIWISQEKDLMPLYKEYGVGILLGIFLIGFNAFNFFITITDEGVVVGSKIEPKLITFEQMESYSFQNHELTISLKDKSIISQISVTDKNQQNLLLSLLSVAKVKKK